MRLIDADAFIRFLAEQRVKNTGMFTKGVNKALNIAISALKNQQITPTVDAVPVVRCGECRFSRGVRPDDGCYPDCIMCENEDMHATIPAPVYVTDFCSYGKRKVDENGRT